MDLVFLPVAAVSAGLAWSAARARRSAAAVQRRLAALQDAVDAERSRLSHDLHDEIGQKLIALKLRLQLSRLPGATSEATHAESVELLDTVIQEVRAMSHAVRPAPFDEGQLIPALTALARAEAARAGLCVLVDALDIDVPVSHDVELACYRVVREAIANIVKHARARHVAVSVHHDEGRLAVSVVDDGRGFAVAPVSRQAVGQGRLGLVGMSERAERVGGRVSIESTPGHGTTVTCLLPLAVAA